tara:strand:+ start:300 stop:749 length:450 start_codon:yes stop_codon:yes gene_type:complete
MSATKVTTKELEQRIVVLETDYECAKAVTATLLEKIGEIEKQMAVLLSDKAVTVNQKKSKKPKKVSSDDDTPKKKKKLSGYILYSNAHRDEVRDELTDDEGAKPKNTDIMKKLAADWKALDNNEKEEWKAKALELSNDDEKDDDNNDED